MAGRRIYIHEFSFITLALRDSRAAALILDALLRTKAAKMINRLIVEDGLAFGTIDNSTAQSIRHRTSQLFQSALTAAFHKLGYRSQEPQKRKCVLRILGRDEGITASCYEAGYYTFATSDHAASAMYDDKEAMGQLRARTRSAASEELTIINGRNLVVLRDDLECDVDNSFFYHELLARNPTSRDVNLATFHDTAAAMVVSDMGSILNQVPEEAQRAYVKTKLDVIHDLMIRPLFDAPHPRVGAA